MSAESKSDKRPEQSQTREPAKGGTTPAHEKAYPAGDSPKPHGDNLEHAVDEATKKKNAN
jgi:hypothetical protein